MSNELGIPGEDQFDPDEKLRIEKHPAPPQPGYGLVFSEQLAQQIMEFVDGPLFKQLKKVYGLQAKTRAARKALNSAQDIPWLFYYKGVASAADTFFKDMEAAREAFIAANSDETAKKEQKFKK